MNNGKKKEPIKVTYYKSNFKIYYLITGEIYNHTYALNNI